MALPACANTNNATQKTTQRIEVTALDLNARFEYWKKDFINRAVAKGYDRKLVSALITPAKINKSALASDKAQPEFTKPIWSYVDGAASASRLNVGQEKLSETAEIFDAIETRYQVPRHILTSIWGLETAYGKIMGDHNIIDSLSTFAFEGDRVKFGESQLFAIFDILKDKDVRVEQLIGSWAGAMGMTQFIPTTFRDYAVDFNNNGNKDLWQDPADALGSAAHYMQRNGWRWREPVMTEVSVEADFDYGLTETTKMTINQWEAHGVKPIGGQKWSTEAGFLEAYLLVPAGYRGPKLLTFKNFDVIKKYNNSTSYAMGITVLGEALRGKTVISTAWPRNDKALSFTDKKKLQSKLNELGYNVGVVDGLIGPNTRQAIRVWQKSQNIPADGYIEKTLLKMLLLQR